MSLEMLAELVYTHSGLTLDKSRQKEIELVVNEIAALVGVDGIKSVCKVLNKLPTHHHFWQLLLRRVTIGETYFFRHMAQYKALQEQILPALIQKRRDANFKYLSIWSAGCATGEELYSVAILLREMLPDIQDWTISLLGTDINQESLTIARQGRYRSHSFRSETRTDIQSRYFKQEDNTFVLNSEIRQMAQFLPLNLINDDYPSYQTSTMHQDIIICRNVTIYFDEPTTRSIVKRFYSTLKDGGWLMVGHAEPLASTYRDFTTQNFTDTIFYQKLPQEVALAPLAPWDEPKTQPKRESLVVPSQVQTPRAAVLPQTSPTPTSGATLQMVRAAMDKEDWEKAIRLLVILESHEPMDAEVHYLRGIVLMHSGQLTMARQALRRALYCAPSYALAHYTMGEIAAQENNPMAARRAWVLAEKAVTGLEDHVLISESDGLTAEMFRGLLALRLSYIEEQRP